MTDASAPAQAAASPHFTVIMRACDKVACVHNVARPFGLTKLETIKVCLYSLIRSLDGVSHSLRIIGDSLSEDAVRFIEAFPQISLRQENFLDPEKTLSLQIETGLKEPDDAWVYFCEDDYLHTRGCFDSIRDLVSNRDTILDTQGGKRNWLTRLGGNVKARPLFVFPSDYPDRYLPRDRRPAFVFAAKSEHWRQISHTTHTFMAEAKTLRRFQDALRESIPGCRDGLLSRRIYGGVLGRDKALCLSPLPGLSAHFTEGVMPPYVDWRAEVERNRRELVERGLW